MCFSASASFGASLLLGAVGVVTLSKVDKPSLLPFAATPILFALHQSSEGLLWLGLPEPKPWVGIAVYVYLLFAQVIWPAWVPYSIWRMETFPRRKKILSVLLGMGLVTALYLLYCLIRYDVYAEIHEGHIRYTLDFPELLVWASALFYFIPIVVSPFVSSAKGMVPLAWALLFSFLVSKVFFTEHLVSVWCFFAALLSAWVLRVIVQNRHGTIGSTLRTRRR
jgi:hypothetical protein